MRNLVLENSFVRKLCCCFFTHGVSCAEVESDWAGISWLEEAPGLFCQTQNTETEKNTQDTSSNKSNVLFFGGISTKKIKLAVPRKQLPMWETRILPHFFWVLSWWPSQYVLLGSSIEMAHDLGSVRFTDSPHIPQVPSAKLTWLAGNSTMNESMYTPVI